MSGLCSSIASRYFSTGVVDAEVDDVEAGAFHHHADEVLADVVDVALDGADHHLALLGRAGGGEQRAQDEHAGLHGVGRQQHFRHEQDAVAEILADDAHAFDERLGQHLVGHPAALEQDVGAFLDLFLQPVIEIVVHLLHEFVVGKLGKDDLVVGHFKLLMAPVPSRRRDTAKLRQYVARKPFEAIADLRLPAKRKRPNFSARATANAFVARPGRVAVTFMCLLATGPHGLMVADFADS